MLTIRRKNVPPQIFFDCVRPLQKWYWYLFRPYRPGAKTLIFHEGKILLVRLGYSHKKWVFPGGGLKRGEQPRDAAIREVKEETGIVLADVTYIGERFYTNQYKKVTQYYFTATTATSDIVIDGQEIIDAAWFPLNALPLEVSPRVVSEVALYTEWKLTSQV